MSKVRSVRGLMLTVWLVMIVVLFSATSVMALPISETTAEPEPTQATNLNDLPIALQMVASENMGQNDATYHLTDTYRFHNMAHTHHYSPAMKCFSVSMV